MVGWSVATITGLGAFDSVAGATTLSQIAPAKGSTTVPAKSGEILNFIVQVTGAPSRAKSWQVIGKLPTGLRHQNATNSNTNAITGIPSESGNFRVTVKAWEEKNFRGGSKSKAFTIAVAPGSKPPAIKGQPESASVIAGDTATLRVGATGSSPTFQWYIGAGGDTSNPIPGATASTYVTPALQATTSYWVRVSNAIGTANSSAATVSVTDTFSSWKAHHFDTPQTADPLISGPSQDPDGDGIINEDEFILGRSPLSADPYEGPSIVVDGDRVTISFTAVRAAGLGYSGLARRYALETSDSLSEGIWTAVPDHAEIVGADQDVSFDSALSPTIKGSDPVI